MYKSYFFFTPPPRLRSRKARHIHFKLPFLASTSCPPTHLQAPTSTAYSRTSNLGPHISPGRTLPSSWRGLGSRGNGHIVTLTIGGDSPIKTTWGTTHLSTSRSRVWVSWVEQSAGRFGVDWRGSTPGHWLNEWTMVSWGGLFSKEPWVVVQFEGVMLCKKKGWLSSFSYILIYGGEGGE